MCLQCILQWEAQGTREGCRDQPAKMMLRCPACSAALATKQKRLSDIGIVHLQAAYYCGATPGTGAFTRGVFHLITNSMLHMCTAYL